MRLADECASVVIFVCRQNVKPETELEIDIVFLLARRCKPLATLVIFCKYLFFVHPILNAMYRYSETLYRGAVLTDCICCWIWLVFFNDDVLTCESTNASHCKLAACERDARAAFKSAVKPFRKVSSRRLYFAEHNSFQTCAAQTATCVKIKKKKLRQSRHWSKRACRPLYCRIRTVNFLKARNSTKCVLSFRSEGENTLLDVKYVT